MAANKLKSSWASGQATLNGWLAIPNAFSAEVFSRAGWDSITVDLQHGLQDYASCVACFQGAQGSGAMPMARVPWNEPGIIGKVLDAGALGVICPMVNSPAEAEALVRACRYPPLGARSNGPIRAGMFSPPGQTYQQTANDAVLVIAMIETRTAVDDLQAILDVPGIDAVYVGPSDLAFSLGLAPRLDSDEPQVLGIFDKILEETAKRGIAAGIHCGSPAYAKRMIARGFKFVTVSSDLLAMMERTRAIMTEMRGEGSA